MSTAKLLLVLFLCTFYVAVYAANPSVKIVFTKKVENCTQRSKKGDLVHVHYTGALQNGDVFDSSYSRNVPFTFTLGTNQVIIGWEIGIVSMCTGEKRQLVIPPELGYGKHGAGNDIPPNSILIFDVEMIQIESREEL